jgi:hypothetical protein
MQHVSGKCWGVFGALILAAACSTEEHADAPADHCPESSAKTPPESGATMSIEAVKACLGSGKRSTSCLDALFLDYLETHSTSEALALLQSYQDQDPQIDLDCHPVAHAIGRGTFAVQGSVDKSFSACDFTCHSGCYHGAMERFLRGDAAHCGEHGHINLQEVKSRVTSACDPNLPYQVYFQCLHGLGHAVMYFSGYDLSASLELCDATADAFSQGSCYGGVFMENLVAAEPEQRDVSESDYHYPCSKLADEYKDACYLMQTSRMTEMGLSVPQLFEQCRVAGAFKLTCITSIGRDLSNAARAGQTALVAQQCSGASSEEREACTRGVAYALADNTWSGEYVFPFCASFEDATAERYCFEIGARYLERTYAKSAGDLAAECGRYVPGNEACDAAASAD